MSKIIRDKYIKKRSHKEIVLTEQNSDFPLKKKYIPKFNEITDEVKIITNSIKYNTPELIEYEGKIFKVSTKNFYDSIEATWRCEFYRRTKDLDADENRFCEAAIKGFKNILTNEFKFYLKVCHSEKCKVLKSKMKNSFINHYVKNNAIKTVCD